MKPSARINVRGRCSPMSWASILDRTFAGSRPRSSPKMRHWKSPASQQLSIVTRAVTFLLTDIEGSTAAWEADADAMAVALARHDEIVEQVVTSRGRAARQDARRGRRDVLGVRSTVGGSRRRHRAAGGDPPRTVGAGASPCESAWPCTPARSSCATATTSAGRSTAPPVCGPWPRVGRSCARARPPNLSSTRCRTMSCWPTSACVT